MSDFAESTYDTMSDEELADFLAHDSELPLSFARGSEEVVYAASVLAARQTEALPAPELAVDVLEEHYLTVPYDGATLWDEPTRNVAAAPVRQAESAASPPAKPKAPAARRAEAAPPIPPIPSGPNPAAREDTPLPPPPEPDVYMPAPERTHGSLPAVLLVILLILLVGGFAVLYIVSAYRSTITGASAASPDGEAAYSLAWVPDGYSQTNYSDWNAAGYLYAWKNGAGDKITFCRCTDGADAAPGQTDPAGASPVSVCGCDGKYVSKGDWRSLVFSGTDGSVYYLDAENVTDGDMQKMIAAVK